ncbi:hypothetical protein GGR50DRAFT_661025 [Xylaria sp. CBS 124048]|nr:hypothetical protein GGR50DRAFT_661025 [Xylaria sp. CBS 124048]
MMGLTATPFLALSSWKATTVLGACSLPPHGLKKYVVNQGIYGNKEGWMMGLTATPFLALSSWKAMTVLGACSLSSHGLKKYVVD